MSDPSQTPLGPLIPRHVEPLLDDAMADTRVVLVAGARQSGKSTLVRQLGKGKDAEWRNLDRSATLEAAHPRLRAVPISALWEIT